MRKIKRMSHLRSELRHLREQRTRLEKNISEDVSRIRYTLNPLNLAREKLVDAAISGLNSLFPRSKK